MAERCRGDGIMSKGLRRWNLAGYYVDRNKRDGFVNESSVLCVSLWLYFCLFDAPAGGLGDN